MLSLPCMAPRAHTGPLVRGPCTSSEPCGSSAWALALHDTQDTPLGAHGGTLGSRASHEEGTILVGGDHDREDGTRGRGGEYDRARAVALALSQTHGRATRGDLGALACRGQ